MNGVNSKPATTILRMPPQDHEHPLVADPGDQRRDQGRNDARQRKERQQQADLRLVQPQLGQEQNEDRPEDGQLAENRIRGDMRKRPRQPAQFFSVGQAGSTIPFILPLADRDAVAGLGSFLAKANRTLRRSARSP